MPQPQTLSTKDFAARVRSAYPDAYKDMSDQELTDRVLTRYPKYRDMVEKQPEPSALDWLLGTIGPRKGLYQHQGAVESVARSARETMAKESRKGEVEGATGTTPEIEKALADLRASRQYRQADPATKAYYEKLTREEHGYHAADVAMSGVVNSTANVVRGSATPQNAALATTATLVPPARLPIGAYYAIKGIEEAGKPQQEDETAPDALERRLLGAATAVGGAAGVKEGIRPTARMIRGTPEALRSAARGSLNIGKRMVQREAQAAISERAAAKAKQAAANAEIREQNLRRLADHAEDSRAVEEINQAGEEAVTKRAELASSIEQQSLELGKRVKALEGKVRQQGSQMFEEVAQATEGESIPASELASVVSYAEENLIRGSQESIKQFRDITRRGGEVDSLSDLMHAAEESPLGFSDLQGYYTEMGEKLASGSIPGDVYRAVKFVRDNIGRQMMQMAEKHGMGGRLTEARAFWRQYEQTFHDMRAVAQGGSPVARAVRAQDPSYMAAPFLGKAATRARGLLQAYDPALAQSASKLSEDFSQMQKLPRKFTPKEAPDAPRLRPEKPEVPPTDVLERIKGKRREEILKVSRSMRHLNMWDVASLSGGLYEMSRGMVPHAFALIALKRGIGVVLDHPRVIEWLSKPTESDFRALSKLPEADRMAVQDAIAEVLENQSRKGQPIVITPPLQRFLGVRGDSPSQLGAASVEARKQGRTAIADVLNDLAGRTPTQKARDVVRHIETDVDEITRRGPGQRPPDVVDAKTRAAVEERIKQAHQRQHKQDAAHQELTPEQISTRLYAEGYTNEQIVEMAVAVDTRMRIIKAIDSVGSEKFHAMSPEDQLALFREASGASAGAGGGSGSPKPTGGLNSPAEAQGFMEQAAQKLFGKAVNQLSYEQLRQVIPEATRLQNEARGGK